MRSDLNLDGKLSGDGKYLVIHREVRFILDPVFYLKLGCKKLGLMPKDIDFSEESTGIEQVITENLGIEKFGNLTMASTQGAIGSVDFSFVCSMVRGQDQYALRHATYKRDDLFTLYLVGQDSHDQLLGLGDTNFEEESVAKQQGIGIKNEFQRRGYGTIFLAAIERECAKNNMLLIMQNPITSEIPFYVSKGYRYLEHSNGLYLAKALNPGFDEKLLVPRS